MICRKLLTEDRVGRRTILKVIRRLEVIPLGDHSRKKRPRNNRPTSNL